MYINRPQGMALLAAMSAVVAGRTQAQAAPGRQRLLHALRAADRAMEQGVIAYSRITSDAGEMARPGKPAQLHVMLTYGRNGHLRLETTAIGGDRQQSVSEEIYDGTTDSVFYPAQGQIVLSGEPPRVLDPVSRMIGLGAGPSFALGRGLSSLRDIVLRRSGRDWMLRGLAGDGTLVTALLDAGHGAVAKWIERRRGGMLIERWRLASPYRATGIWIASRSELDLFSAGDRIYHDTYALQQTRFTAPAAGFDRPRIPPSAGTYDTRTRERKEARDRTMLAQGTQAPDFQATTADGRLIKLSDLRGSTVVLDFWATWCPPCQQSLPETAAIARKYADLHVTVLAVNEWDSEQAFKEWLPKHSDYAAIRFAIVPLSAGTDVARTLYHVAGIPATYIINAEGKIVRSFKGYNGPSHRLEEALAAAGVPPPIADTSSR